LRGESIFEFKLPKNLENEKIIIVIESWKMREIKFITKSFLKRKISYIEIIAEVS
jgi:UDP-glucose 6-dehydrogenase